jgi:hypothetical protein
MLLQDLNLEGWRTACDNLKDAFRQVGYITADFPSQQLTMLEKAQHLIDALSWLNRQEIAEDDQHSQLVDFILTHPAMISRFQDTKELALTHFFDEVQQTYIETYNSYWQALAKMLADAENSRNTLINKNPNEIKHTLSHQYHVLSDMDWLENSEKDANLAQTLRSYANRLILRMIDHFARLVWQEENFPKPQHKLLAENTKGEPLSFFKQTPSPAKKEKSSSLLFRKQAVVTKTSSKSQLTLDLSKNRPSV